MQMDMNMSMEMMHDMSEMSSSNDLPCSSCFAANNDMTLKETLSLSFEYQIPAIEPIAFDDANTCLITENDFVAGIIPANSNAPPLVGSVILRT